MEFLKLKPATKHQPEKYKYLSGTDGEVVEVEVSYTKGFEGVWGGSPTKRGIYIQVHVVKLETVVTPERSYTIRSFTINLGGGSKDARTLLLEQPRLNTKKLRDVAEFFDPIVGQLAHRWLSENGEARAAFLARLEEFKAKYGLLAAAA